jgi:dsDNA-binding SOS-regulon protein
MAVIVKYVVISHGKDEMIFSTRKEAEAYDKMLDIAERLYTYLQTAELTIAEDTLEALTIFMAQHRADVDTILKGGKLKTPTVRTQHASVPQDKSGASASLEPKGNKASQSAPPAQPKAAA